MLEFLYWILTYINVYTVLTGLPMFVCIVYWRCKTERNGIPPGPPFLPVLGNMLDMRGEYLMYKHKYFTKLQQEYGDVFRVYFGSQLMIILNGFESIDEAFVKQKDIFTTRPSDKLWTVRLEGKDGHGVFWSNGERWKSHRRLAIQSLRNLGVGKSRMEERILEEADFMMETFPVDEPFSIRQPLIRATTNIIGFITFGTRWEYDDPELMNIIDLFEVGFKSESFFSPIQEFPCLRLIPSLAGKLRGIRNLFSKIAELIDERVKSHEKSFTQGKIRDFIDVVLTEIGKDQEVDVMSLKQTVKDFLFAGAETTGTTLDWAFLYMVSNPAILKKCQAEIDIVIGSNRKLSYSDRAKLPYVEATLLEVQRIGTIGIVTPPHTPDRDTYIKGYLIPAGSLVLGHLYSCHMDPVAWPDPHKFDPQRFLDMDGKLKKLPPSFMPFSTGPRQCPGDILAKMEIFLFFSSIIQRYDITKANPDDELDTDGAAGITRIPPPFELRISLRKHLIK